MLKIIFRSISRNTYYYLVLVMLFFYELCMFLSEVDVFAHKYVIMKLTKPVLLSMLLFLGMYIYINYRYIKFISFRRFWKLWLIVTCVVCLPIHLMVNDVNSGFEYIIQYVRLFLLPFLLYYFFSLVYIQKGIRKEEVAWPYFIFWCVIAFLYYSNIGNIIVLREGNNGLYAVNYVYYILMLLPSIFMLKIKICIVPIIISAIAIMLSGKRGGILVLVFMCCSHLVVNIFYSRKGKACAKTVLMLLFLILMSIVLSNIFNTSIENITSRFRDLKSDGGSGRIEIYTSVIKAYLSNNMSGLLFGNGVESTKLVTKGLTAHNDLLEILYDYGLVSFIVILLLYKNMLSKLVTLYKKNSELTYAFSASVMLFVILTNISHVIVYPHFLILVPFFAFVFNYKLY